MRLPAEFGWCPSTRRPAGVEYYYYDQLGSAYMDPAHMQRVADRLPLGQYLYCPEESHLAMYDDQHTYFSGLLQFLLGLRDDGRPRRR
jgi:hypothetical protein